MSSFSFISCSILSLRTSFFMSLVISTYLYFIHAFCSSFLLSLFFVCLIFDCLFLTFAFFFFFNLMILFFRTCPLIFKTLDKKEPKIVLPKSSDLCENSYDLYIWPGGPTYEWTRVTAFELCNLEFEDRSDDYDFLNFPSLVFFFSSSCVTFWSF